MFVNDMTGKQVVLLSSSLAAITAALFAWIAVYSVDPQQANVQELYQIQQDLHVYQAAQSVEPTEITTVMAWWYPGEPACAAVTEAAQLQLDVVKPEYFVIRDGGMFEFMTEEIYGCNGYSKETAATARTLAPEQFVMVSASYAPDMDAFLRHDARTGEYTKRLVDFVVSEEFTGVELDFEDFGGWTPDIYEQYTAFLTRLGTALHEVGKELMIDLPPVRNSTEEAWYVFRLGELEQLPIDYIVVMGYDYQYDHGAGQPVAPLDWLGEVVRFTKSRMQYDEKIVIGVPSYGYVADHRNGRINIVTKEQAEAYPIHAHAERDPSSSELIAEGARYTVVYQDALSIQAKLDVVAENGVDKVSVWHLGGNPLFLR